MYCEQCGRQIEEDYLFCPYCGSDVAPQVQLSCCPKCETELPDGAVFCPRCGISLYEHRDSQSEPHSRELSEPHLERESKPAPVPQGDTEANDMQKLHKRAVLRWILVWIPIVGLIYSFIVLRGVRPLISSYGLTDTIRKHRNSNYTTIAISFLVTTITVVIFILIMMFGL